MTKRICETCAQWQEGATVLGHGTCRQAPAPKTIAYASDSCLGWELKIPRKSSLRYLYISSDAEGQIVFPCDAWELADVMRLVDIKLTKTKLLEAWPDNSHGPAFPMNRYCGSIILDLQSENPAAPLTKEEVALIVAGTTT
jgi:hypothetical protein